MATIPMDIKGIQKSVYGRDAREPIADACELLKKKHQRSIVKRLDSVDAESIPDSNDCYNLVFEC